MSTKIKINRNNTSFQLQLFEHLKSAKWDNKYDFLKYHQNIVRFFNESTDVGARGLLIYHETGTGKSLIIVAIAMDTIESGENRKVIFLLSKSLHENLRGTIKKYIKLRATYDPDYYLAKLSDNALNDWILDKFRFVSMNASNMVDQLSIATTDREVAAIERKLGSVVASASLDNCMVLIDEYHNMARAITNGSKNATKFYDLTMAAKNIKLYFFTGTPINGSSFELVPTMNMLSGSRTTLPEDYRDFMSAFADPVDGKLINKEKFQNRLFGLISMAARDSTFGKGAGLTIEKNRAEYPEEYPLEVVRVNMAQDQYSAYLLAAESESLESQFRGKQVDTAAIHKPKGQSSSSYHVKTRMISNFYYRGATKDILSVPIEEVTSPKFVAILANINKHANQLGLVYSQFVGIAGLGSFARFLATRGYAEYSGEDAPSAADNNAFQEDEPDEFGGGFEEFRGDIIGAAAAPIDYDKSQKYAAITGNVPFADRQKLVNVYSSDENKYGSVISLLLISASGAEGLDLSNVRHIHALEPYWNYARIAQVIARGVRSNSHIMLPREQRNVQPYIYLAIQPVGEKELKTIDVTFYETMINDYLAISSFTSALREVAIECLLNADHKCHVCSPTNKQLYTTNIKSDIAGPNPCTQLKEEKIIAKEIIVGDKAYFYREDPDSIYEYKIFQRDDTINAYRALRENSSAFAEVLDAIIANK